MIHTIADVIVVETDGGSTTSEIPGTLVSTTVCFVLVGRAVVDLITPGVHGKTVAVVGTLVVCVWAG